jgi:hypothetical protein
VVCLGDLGQGDYVATQFFLVVVVDAEQQPCLVIDQDEGGAGPVQALKRVVVSHEIPPR